MLQLLFATWHRPTEKQLKSGADFWAVHFLQNSRSTGALSNSSSEYTKSQYEASAANKDNFFRQKQAVCSQLPEPSRLCRLQMQRLNNTACAAGECIAA